MWCGLQPPLAGWLLQHSRAYALQLCGLLLILALQSASTSDWAGADWAGGTPRVRESADLQRDAGQLGTQSIFSSMKAGCFVGELNVEGRLFVTARTSRITRRQMQVFWFDCRAKLTIVAEANHPTRAEPVIPPQHSASYNLTRDSLTVPHVHTRTPNASLSRPRSGALAPCACVSPTTSAAQQGLLPHISFSSLRHTHQQQPLQQPPSSCTTTRHTWRRRSSPPPDRRNHQPTTCCWRCGVPHAARTTLQMP